jgi:hypothetical protein
MPFVYANSTVTGFMAWVATISLLVLLAGAVVASSARRALI